MNSWHFQKTVLRYMHILIIGGHQMPVLTDLQPACVLRYFEELCAIPHGSGNTKAISDYCVRFAEEHGLEYHQDALNNVIIIKPASEGYEDAPAVILQGHLDMVCEKTADCALDMAVQGLDVATDGEWIWANGTTLGGDDGIAVAMALAALDDDSLPHPRLEVVLTVDEEIGMEGAVGLDTSCLQGRVMLNVDSEVEGILTVSCAGGVRACCHVPVERETTEGVLCEILIGGLLGGHSGVEIHKGRANSNMLMGRLLYGLSREMALRIIHLHGGQADNAIAPRTEAAVLIPAEEVERAQALTESYNRVFCKEFASVDPGVTVVFRVCQKGTAPALTLAATARVTSALMLLPNGVQTMSQDIPGLVQTSLNLGVLRLEEQEMTATFAVRSSVATEKAMICNRIDCLSSLLGGCVTYAGDYPGWEYLRDSKLRELVADVYGKQTGKKPVIEAIHAGLDCGVFAGKLPGLDCVSIGPDMDAIHTPKERLSIPSTQRTWALVCEVLRRSKEL